MSSPSITPPFVVLLTGPAGSGKTTIARAWAEAQARPTAHLALDTIRQFIRSGYADPQHGWNDEAQRQYEFAREACGWMAHRYVREGVCCIIDDAFFPCWEAVSYDGWRRTLSGVEHHVFVLLPNLEVVLYRNRQRDVPHRLADDEIITIYRMMEPWADQHVFPVVDTSNQSVNSSVAALSSIIALIQPATEG